MCLISSMTSAPSSLLEQLGAGESVASASGSRDGRRRRPRRAGRRRTSRPARRVCRDRRRARRPRRPGRCGGLGGGPASVVGAGPAAARLDGRRRLGARRGRDRGWVGRRLGAGVDDRLDPPVGTDDVDHRLPEDPSLPPLTNDSRAPALLKPDRQRRAVDPDHLGVLAEQDPGEPALALDRLDDVGPEPAYVDQGESAAPAGARGRVRRGSGAGPARARGSGAVRLGRRTGSGAGCRRGRPAGRRRDGSTGVGAGGPRPGGGRLGGGAGDRAGAGRRRAGGPAAAIAIRCSTRSSRASTRRWRRRRRAAAPARRSARAAAAARWPRAAR